MFQNSKRKALRPSQCAKSQNDQHTFPNPSLAADGFNIWWQKTIAQNMAMVTEAWTSCVRTV